MRRSALPLWAVPCAAAVLGAALVGAPAPAVAEEPAGVAASADDIYFLTKTQRSWEGPSDAVTENSLWRASSATPGNRSFVSRVPRGATISPQLDATASTRRVPGGVEVVVAELDGSHEQVVATLSPADAWSPCSAPVSDLSAEVRTWAADGTRLLIKTSIDGSSCQTPLLVVGVQPGDAPVPLPKLSDALFDPRDSSRFFAVRNDQGVVSLGLDGTSREIMAPPRTFTVSLSAVAASPDGSRLYLVTRGFKGASAQVISTADGAEIASYYRASAAKFSPDGQSLYSTAHDEEHPDRLDGIGWQPVIEGAPGPGPGSISAPVDMELVAALPGSAPGPLVVSSFSASLRGTHTVLSWTARSSVSSFVLYRYAAESRTGGRSLRYAGAAGRFNDRVQTGQAYTYELWTRDRDGRVHGPAVLHSVATRPPALQTPPRFSTHASVPLRWGTPGNAGDTAYQVKRDGQFGPTLIGRGRYSTNVDASTTISVRAVDRFANASPAVTATVLRVNDDATGTQTTPADAPGRWVRTRQGSVYFATLSTSRTRGRTLDFLDRTSDVYAGGPVTLYLFGDKGPGHGKLRVDLDGKSVATVDTWAPTLQHRVVLWSGKGWAGPGVSDGQHSLGVVNLATPKRPLVAIDGWARTG